MRYAYYPGCSLKGTGKAYEKSFLSLFNTLEIDLQEIPDWNCCGATTYMAIDDMAGLALSLRNIVLAQQMGFDKIVAPCSACYLNLLKARTAMLDEGERKEKLCNALLKSGMEFDCSALPEVLHPLQVLTEEVGIEKFKEKVKRPLTGLKVIPYYGCQIVRPFTDYDDPVYPVKLDLVLEAAGAEVISDYPLKTRCCGASLTGTIEKIGIRLNYLLLKEAKKRKADVIVTLCSLCYFNLEMYQYKMEEHFKMPILYFTQLLGYAMGISKKDLDFKRALYKPALEVKDV